MDFNWRWGVGTGYSLGPWRRDMNARIQRAALRATDKASRGMRENLQAQMRGRRLGNLANAVKQTSDHRRQRIKRYGEGGFSASGIVYVGTKNERTTGALAAYLDGPVNITPKSGRKWLAIATKEIPKRAGRKRMTPALYVANGLEEKIGPLRFVPGKRAGVAYLIADNVTVNPERPGKARRLPKTGRVRAGRAQVGIVAFVLIRVTRRDKRVDVRQLARKWQDKVIPLLSRELSGT